MCGNGRGCWLLLSHGVLDDPSLSGAGLEDQQVAKVNICRHDFQTAPCGSVYDGLVLKDNDKETMFRTLIVIRAYTVAPGGAAVVKSKPR